MQITPTMKVAQHTLVAHVPDPSLHIGFCAKRHYHRVHVIQSREWRYTTSSRLHDPRNEMHSPTQHFLIHATCANSVFPRDAVYEQ